MVDEWHEEPANADFVRRLRKVINGPGRLLVFLGAGLSFGAARLHGRTQFDYHRYDHWWSHDFPFTPLTPDDDGLPLPDWPMLVNRMCRETMMNSPTAERDALRTFFIEEGPLDTAQLFRQTVGEANYAEFLRQQFDASRYPFVHTTPSHAALVRLDLPLLFTTNFDELIETAYREANVQLRVSISEDQFTAHRTQSPARHLVKLHGSIDQPETIVLTRSDYAAARAQRKEMLGFLRSEMAETTFLFIGFSLSDPNFNLLHDDIRLEYGINVPVSYTVQARRNPVKERYLRSLDINTIWLDRWNDLPNFLTRISQTGARGVAQEMSSD
ncbi:MAG: SIR2 family protein [Mycobacterium sp.]|uniref:SIR2 family NAD-dependent protein deacylase n=1 Tax=Mycobacterium sp. TaxID=1785 RepID=UPI001ECA6978|nr:SIR2 family protein [Mycobacterium sp.]MBW0016496.1 SIR2 family protein [Mycobacterium sp.]